jgi:hypothetical protein
MSDDKVYLLMYCRDDGSRESWSVFYTPVEVFPSKEMRDARIAYLSSRDPELEFETCDELIMTDPNKRYDVYGDDEDDEGFDEDGGIPAVHSGGYRDGFLELIAEAAAAKSTDVHVTLTKDDQ